MTLPHTMMRVRHQKRQENPRCNPISLEGNLLGVLPALGSLQKELSVSKTRFSHLPPQTVNTSMSVRPTPYDSTRH